MATPIDFRNQRTSNTGQQMFNNLMGMATLQENRKRNKLLANEDSRRDAEHKYKMLAIPFAWEQRKLGHVRDVAAKLSAMPAADRKEKYQSLLKIAETPIANHPELGPLGVVNRAYFMDPKDFNAMDEGQQLEYMKLLSRTADQLAKLDLESAKAEAEGKKIAAQHANKLAQIRREQEADLDVAEEKGYQARETERVKGQEDRKTEKVKNKGKTGPGTDKTQNRIDKYRAAIPKLEAEIVKLESGGESKIDKLMTLFAQQQGLGAPQVDKPQNKAQAIKAARDLIAWYRKRLRKLETGAKTGTKADDPLGILD